MRRPCPEEPPTMPVAAGVPRVCRLAADGPQGLAVSAAASAARRRQERRRAAPGFAPLALPWPRRGFRSRFRRAGAAGALLRVSARDPARSPWGLPAAVCRLHVLLSVTVPAQRR